MSKTDTFVKICGITREEDLQCAVESGASAIGFIAYEKSPRYITPGRVRELLKNCPERIRRVVVTVNAELEEVRKYIEAGIDTVQLHGSETAEYADQIQAVIWKAVRLHKSEQIEEFKNFPCAAFVVDSFVKDSSIPGGTGHKADWELAKKFTETVSVPVLLAGGIKEENALEALEEVGCFGLDLSSGVEIEPGIKDSEKIRSLFKILK